MSGFRTMAATFLMSIVLYSLIAGSASANRLSFSEATRRVTYSPLRIVPLFGSTVSCPVTLESSLHSRTISKVPTALIGYLFRAQMGTCESGSARFNTATLPWHRTWFSFAGALPEITSVAEGVLGMRVEIQGELFGLRVICGYDISNATFTSVRESRGGISGEVPDGTQLFPSLTEGCPQIRLNGSGRVTTPGGTVVTITLI